MKRPSAWFIVASTAAGLAIGSFTTVLQPPSGRLAAVAGVAVLAFAAPAYVTIVRVLGFKRGIGLLIAVGIYALLIESAAIKTGVPYGHFIYQNALGSKLFGLTPWTVAFAYPPILFGAFAVAQWWQKTTTGNSARITIFTACLAMLADLVLDPAAVRLGYWYWPGGGLFYSVPVVNFVGWLVSGSIGAMLIVAILRQRVIPLPAAWSSLAIVWFWTTANVWLGQWIPAIIGLVLSVGLLRLFGSQGYTGKHD